MATTFIGLDPGRSGGIACLYAHHDTPLVQKLDGQTEADIAGLLRELGGRTPVFAYIEQVSPNRNQSTGGGRAQGSSGMFTFGRSYGFLRGCLVALKIPFEEVRPQKWLPEMGLRGIKDESTTDKKNRHKQKAQQLFPSVKLTHATSDAILLAEYGRRASRTASPLTTTPTQG